MAAFLRESLAGGSGAGGWQRPSSLHERFRIPPDMEADWTMRISSDVVALGSVEAQWLAVGVFDGKPDPRSAPADTALGELIGQLIASKDISGSVGETTPFFKLGVEARNVLAFGLGTAEKFDAGAAFHAGVAVGKRLAAKPKGTVAVVVPEVAETPAIVSALTEGVLVGTQGPGLKKTEPARHAFEELKIVVPTGGTLDAAALAAIVRRSEVVGEAVNRARWLVNLPPSEKAPEVLANWIAEEARAVGGTVEVWDRERIAAERFGGLLGVSAGSAKPPAFVVLEYQGAGESPALALVGKGVTFDSGGLSLKPSASMEDMKADMTGAAVVAATLQAVAKLNLPVNLRGYIPLTENMTGGDAMKLGDVLTMRNGTTVEVLNTDAEGRLILADALAFATEQKPARILDLATLTGACMVALGPKVAGLFSNDAGFAGALLSACRKTGERAWRMPLDDDYEELLKSNVADCKNVGGKWGGAITAAKFLQKFVSGLPWVHLDIAGPSWSDSENAVRDAGGTGCFVRTLVALAENLATGEASA